MKKNNKRLVSILLLFAFLISTLSVFTFFSAAEEEGEGGLDEDILVLYNRTFDEGHPENNPWTQNNAQTQRSSAGNQVSKTLHLNQVSNQTLSKKMTVHTSSWYKLTPEMY